MNAKRAFNLLLEHYKYLSLTTRLKNKKGSQWLPFFNKLNDYYPHLEEPQSLQVRQPS